MTKRVFVPNGGTAQCGPQRHQRLPATLSSCHRRGPHRRQWGRSQQDRRSTRVGSDRPPVTPSPARSLFDHPVARQSIGFSSLTATLTFTIRFPRSHRDRNVEIYSGEPAQPDDIEGTFAPGSIEIRVSVDIRFAIE